MCRFSLINCVKSFFKLLRVHISTYPILRFIVYRMLTMRNLARLTYCLLVLQSGSAVWAANLYVTSSGAGSKNGSSWTNAFAGFSGIVWGSGTGQLGPDTTLWIAGGTYNGTFAFHGSGTSGHPIYIKRAVASDSACTGAAGWNIAYDTQVLITPTSSSPYGFLIDDSSSSPPGKYTFIDGITDDGIRINLSQTAAMYGIYIAAKGAFNSTFKNITIHGPSTNAVSPGDFVWKNEVTGLATFGNSDYLSYLTFDNVDVNGVVTGWYGNYAQYIILQNSDWHTIECWQGDPHTNIGWFSRMHYLTIRWNIFHDMLSAVGLFFTYYGDGGVRSSYIYIYGNIFRDGTSGADVAVFYREGDPGYSNDGTGPFYIYNNTLVRWATLFLNNGSQLSSTQSYIQNNLLGPGANNLASGNLTNMTVNNNISGALASQFISIGSKNVLASPYQWQYVCNLHLSSATQSSGITLSDTYMVDKDGQIRGADGYWDIGAYEYIKLAIPNNLRITAIQ
jgi:hypothetical protein